MQCKWLDFLYLASTSFKSRVWLFLLDQRVMLLLVEDDKKVNKRKLSIGQSQERKSSSNVTAQNSVIS